MSSNSNERTVKPDRPISTVSAADGDVSDRIRTAGLNLGHRVEPARILDDHERRVAKIACLEKRRLRRARDAAWSASFEAPEPAPRENILPACIVALIAFAAAVLVIGAADASRPSRAHAIAADLDVR